MRILVCGGRKYADINPYMTVRDLAFLTKNVEKYFQVIEEYQLGVAVLKEYVNGFDDVTFITGMAPGADKLVFAFEEYPLCTIEEYLADWKTHGKAAGFIRNQQMIDEGKPDLVVAFPGGSGTADMIRRAKKAGIPVREVEGLATRYTYWEKGDRLKNG